MKSEVSRELTLEVGSEVVIREKGRRRIEDIFIIGNIWVPEDNGEELSCEGESKMMKWRDASVRAQAGGWTGPKRSRSCSQCVQSFGLGREDSIE